MEAWRDVVQPQFVERLPVTERGRWMLEQAAIRNRELDLKTALAAQSIKDQKTKLSILAKREAL
jgi:hypothetical protein